jgi:hypothetical protein
MLQTKELNHTTPQHFTFPRYDLEVSGSLIRKATIHNEAVHTVEYRFRVRFSSYILRETCHL